MTPEDQESCTESVTLTRYCRRCRRKLRDPRSMKIGYGPVCAAKEVRERLAAKGGEQ
jgi:hypothetical protein